MGPILYMLEAYEELFSKELDRLVEEVLRCVTIALCSGWFIITVQDSVVCFSLSFSIVDSW